MADGAKKILIIDDEEDICSFTKRLLERNGKYNAEYSRSSRVGIQMAKDIKPDLILLDINMPDFDGGAVAQELSNDASTRDIPIVFITGLMTKEDLDAEGKVNKHYFLPKPIASQELFAKIEQVLEQ